MTINNQTIQEDSMMATIDFLKMIGFDDKKIADHLHRLGQVSLNLIIDDLEKLTALKEKEPLPETESLKDFFDYYAQYADKEIINKIISENVQKVYSEYLNSIIGELNK